MSNFQLTAKEKKTGRIVAVEALDDYYGRHRYGYRIDGGEVLHEDAFNHEYEEVTRIVKQGVQHCGRCDFVVGHDYKYCPNCGIGL